MNEATFTFQVDESLKDQFTMAAKACDRSDADLLRDFMRDFVGKQRCKPGSIRLMRENWSRPKQSRQNFLHGASRRGEILQHVREPVLDAGSAR